MVISVKNLNGTADNPAPAPYSSWIEFWEKATGEEARICHRVGCYSTQNLVGAHVQLDDPNDDRWWIVPLCQSCNCKRGGHFTVEGPLVWTEDPTVILR